MITPQGTHYINRFNTVANYITCTRIALVVPLIYLISQPDKASRLAALFVLILAGITDGLDGFFARKLHQESKYGLILDPIADKLLVISLGITFILYYSFPLWLALIIISRDILIILGNAYLMLRVKNIEPPPSKPAGKYAFTSFLILLASYYIDFPFGKTLSTYTSLVLIALSMSDYTRLFIEIASGKGMTSLFDIKPKQEAMIIKTLLLAFIVAYLLAAYFWLSSPSSLGVWWRA